MHISLLILTPFTLVPVTALPKPSDQSRASNSHDWQGSLLPQGAPFTTEAMKRLEQDVATLTRIQHEYSSLPRSDFSHPQDLSSPTLMLPGGSHREYSSVPPTYGGTPVQTFQQQGQLYPTHAYLATKGGGAESNDFSASPQYTYADNALSGGQQPEGRVPQSVQRQSKVTGAVRNTSIKRRIKSPLGEGRPNRSSADESERERSTLVPGRGTGGSSSSGRQDHQAGHRPPFQQQALGIEKADVPQVIEKKKKQKLAAGLISEARKALKGSAPMTREQKADNIYIMYYSSYGCGTGLQLPSGLIAEVMLGSRCQQITERMAWWSTNGEFCHHRYSSREPFKRLNLPDWALRTNITCYYQNLALQPWTSYRNDV